MTDTVVGAQLSARSIKVHFGGVKAVDGVDMSFASGVSYGLVGPNGSGKSTLLAAISRLIPLTGGRLELDGRDVTAGSPSRLARLGLARTFQTVRLVPGLTVLENVMLGGDRLLATQKNRSGAGRGLFLTRSRRREGDLRDLAHAVLGDLALDSVANAHPAELSYGTQRRVEIARALLSRPRLLLLDEPTAGMNQEERAEISVILRKLNRDGLTVLLVEHDLRMIQDVCDQLYVMNFGKVLTQGRPEVCIEDPRVIEAYMGERS